MDENTLVWYVAYGSNLEDTGLGHHLSSNRGPRAEAHRAATDGEPLPESRWIDIPHSLYFAGRSKNWRGPVAFLSLTPGRAGNQARGRAFLVTISQLRTIAQSENGCPDMPDITYALQIPQGAWAPLPVELAKDGYKGKYNAILRLSDAPDSRAVVTLTTSRRLEMGAPSKGYLSRVRAGLGSDPAHADQRQRLDTALGFRGRNDQFVDQRAAVPMQWRGTIFKIGHARGLPSITLPRRFNGLAGEVAFAQATMVSNRGRIPIWVHFEDVAEPAFSPAALHLLDSDVVKQAGHAPLAIDMEEIEIFERVRGDAQDLPDSDVVHVSQAEAKRLGKWALFINNGVVGPVRVAARSQMPPEKVRVAYAARTLLSHDPDCPVLLQPIRPGSGRLRSLFTRPFHALGDAVLGAPALALRATEGLVGDEGRPVIRVDVGALDFIGAEAGDTVVVTWAHRRVKARVLLQSDLTRQRMDHQLVEGTGQQLRDIIQEAGIASRLSVPPHLRAWVSPTLRTMLQIPADTVIRIRRSTGHLLLKNSARLAFPLAALLVGGLAIPNVDPTWWVVASAIVVVLTLIPLRLRHVNGNEHKRRAPRS